MGCGRCQITPVALDEITLAWVRHGRKALADRSRRLICIDPDWWRGVSLISGRAAVICHEWAHLEGANCEPCADERGGEHLRALGFSPRDAVRTFIGELKSRPGAFASLLDGYAR